MNRRGSLPPSRQATIGSLFYKGDNEEQKEGKNRRPDRKAHRNSDKEKQQIKP